MLTVTNTSFELFFQSGACQGIHNHRAQLERARCWARVINIDDIEFAKVNVLAYTSNSNSNPARETFDAHGVKFVKYSQTLITHWHTFSAEGYLLERSLCRGYTCHWNKLCTRAAKREPI